MAGTGHVAQKVRRFRRPEASKYLQEEWGILRKPKTLAKLAVIGGGPVFQKDARTVLYTEMSLDEWARSQWSAPVSSTAEFKAIGAAPQIETQEGASDAA